MRLQTEQIEAGAQPLGAAAWGLGAENPAALLTVTEAERLEYLCDMLGELRMMAEEASLRPLATILALAHEEAQQKLNNR